MSRKPNSPGWLIGSLAFAAVSVAFVAARPKAAAPSNPDVAPLPAPGKSLVLSDRGRRRGALVEIDLSELTAAGAPTDELHRLSDFEGRRQKCSNPECGGSAIVSAVNTTLVVYRLEPHYTCAVTRCYSEVCKGESRAISPIESSLERYLATGLPIMLHRYPMAEGDVIAAIDHFYSSPRTLADTTPVQQRIYDLAIGRLLTEPTTELPDPNLAVE